MVKSCWAMRSGLRRAECRKSNGPLQGKNLGRIFQSEDPGKQRANPIFTDWLFAKSDPCGQLRKQVDRAGLFDRVVDLAMQLGGNSGDTTGKDLTGLRRELGEKLRIGGDDLVCRNVVTTTRHPTVRLAEVNTALNCFWLGHGKWMRCSLLAEFAVKGAALEEVVELHFLEATRSTKALFVTRGDVT